MATSNKRKLQKNPCPNRKDGCKVYRHYVGTECDYDPALTSVVSRSTLQRIPEWDMERFDDQTIGMLVRAGISPLEAGPYPEWFDGEDLVEMIQGGVIPEDLDQIPRWAKGKTAVAILAGEFEDDLEYGERSHFFHAEDLRVLAEAGVSGSVAQEYSPNLYVQEIAELYDADITSEEHRGYGYAKEAVSWKNKGINSTDVKPFFDAGVDTNAIAVSIENEVSAEQAAALLDSVGAVYKWNPYKVIEMAVQRELVEDPILLRNTVMKEGVDSLQNSESSDVVISKMQLALTDFIIAGGLVKVFPPNPHSIIAATTIITGNITITNRSGISQKMEITQGLDKVISAKAAQEVIENHTSELRGY